MEQLADFHVAEKDTGIGESEKRHYDVVDQRMQCVFHILERRDYFVG